MYAGRYGDLPETLITTISGQKPLDPNLWGDYLPVIADIPLEPFSDAEARQFLASKDITDEATIQVILTLSGRLPLWLATLAEARPAGQRGHRRPGRRCGRAVPQMGGRPGARRIAIAAALPRVLNQDVLAAIAPAIRRVSCSAGCAGCPSCPSGGNHGHTTRSCALPCCDCGAPRHLPSGALSRYLLAQANARWASDATEGTDDAWANPDWVDYTREETYHLLCADPVGNLPKALASAVKAAEHSPIRARQWAVLIADAGRDANNNRLREWGQRLTDGIHGDDLGPLLHLPDQRRYAR